MPDEKKFNPTYAEPSTQYSSNYPFSEIVFPENIPVMSADLNELQLISNKKIAELLVNSLCSNNNTDYISGNGLGDGGYWVPISYNSLSSGETNVIGYFVNKSRTESYRIDLTCEKFTSPIYLKATSVMYAGEDDTGESLTNAITSNKFNNSLVPSALINYLQDNSFNESVNRRKGYKFELVQELPDDLTGSSYILIYDGSNWIYPSYISMFDNSKSQEDFVKIQDILSSIWLFDKPDAQRDVLYYAFNAHREDIQYSLHKEGDQSEVYVDEIKIEIGKYQELNRWSPLELYFPANPKFDHKSIYLKKNVTTTSPIFSITESGFISDIHKKRYFIYCHPKYENVLILARVDISDPNSWTVIDHYECDRIPDNYIYETNQLPNPTDPLSLILLICFILFSYDSESDAEPDVGWHIASVIPKEKYENAFYYGCPLEEIKKFGLVKKNYRIVGSSNDSIYNELTLTNGSGKIYPYLPKTFVDLFDPKYPVFEDYHYILPGGEKIDIRGNTRRYEQVYTISTDKWILAEHSESEGDTVTICGVKINCDTWYYRIDDEVAAKIPTNATVFADIALDGFSPSDHTAIETMTEAYQNIMRIIGVNPITTSDGSTAAILISHDSKPDANFNIRLVWLYNY